MVDFGRRRWEGFEPRGRGAVDYGEAEDEEEADGSCEADGDCKGVSNPENYAHPTRDKLGLPLEELLGQQRDTVRQR